MESCAIALGPHGIRCNSILPGSSQRSRRVVFSLPSRSQSLTSFFSFPSQQEPSPPPSTSTISLIPSRRKPCPLELASVDSVFVSRALRSSSRFSSSLSASPLTKIIPLFFSNHLSADDIAGAAIFFASVRSLLLSQLLSSSLTPSSPLLPPL